MIASFQDDDDGLEHHLDMPTDLPDPESLPRTSDTLGHIDHDFARHWANDRPFDMRHIPSSIYLTVDGEHTSKQMLWMKTFEPIPDDPDLHRAALAYVSDYSIMEPVMRRHGLAWATPGLKVASLDHAMWWHRFGRVDEWMLYVQDSPSAQGGRGLSTGSIYSREGLLLATVAQEGMVRVPKVS
jgi:acyl-CoA thioesterase-2